MFRDKSMVPDIKQIRKPLFTVCARVCVYVCRPAVGCVVSVLKL